ncbi:hypothetical protein [Paraurantiacibacter namhicola]|uniref:Uncharacterized protein n=1 Tax=Paraurantiacibacter namhicola TaxID=645517 RepID=A0A1C7DAN2_9SPHN|nr:hypothetical protein [Paraurantiacibacter namhicola]ANU08505.1 hypothetical protein A6F65_02221 [Paraurantiacibacter namhicola]
MSIDNIFARRVFASVSAMAMTGFLLLSSFAYSPEATILAGSIA